METESGKELRALRVSMARVAQALRVDNALRVKDKEYSELYALAGTQERGWNDLACLCAAKACLILGEAAGVDNGKS
jgi:hypothetical protein